MAQTNLKPGTFTLEAADAIQQRNYGLQLGQSGVQGGGGVAAADPLQRQVIDTSTSDLLWSLGRKILEPRIQQIQTEKFLEGAQRVAQGEALKEIVDEQPWFTKIFGPSSSVQGARAVAQMKGVDDYLTEVANDMPNLAKLDSKEFGQQITGKMKDFLTGDSVADAAIQMKMVEATGGLFKAHTKAHYKWTQDTMQQQITGYMRSGGAKLKAMTKQLQEGVMSQQDYDDAVANYVGNLMPLDGQSPESYWSAIEESTIDALANENHHAANAIFGSGIFDSAPAEVRKKLIDARHTYEARTQETAGFYEYGPLIGQLKGMAAAGQLTGNQILAEVDKINEDYKLRYGIDRPLFKRKEMEAILSGNISAIYRRQEADARDLARERRADARDAAKERVKTEAELRKSQQLVGLVQMGAGNLATLAGYSRNEVDNAVYQGAQVIASKGGDVGKFLVQQYNEGGEHVNSIYKNQLQAGMRVALKEGHSGQAFEQTYGMFKQLSKEPGGKAAALAYLGDDGIKMMKYDQFVSNGRITPEVAYQLAFAEPLDTSRKSSDKEVGAAIQKLVDNDQPGWFSRTFTDAETLTEQSRRSLVTAVGRNYDKLAGNLALGDEEAMAVALKVAKSEMDVAGPYVIERGPDRKPIYELIGADEEKAGKVFAEFVATEARKQGVMGRLPGAPDDSTVRTAADFVTAGPVPAATNWVRRKFGDDPTVVINRLPDQNGVGMFAVTVVTPDGDTKFFPVNSDDLRKYYEGSKQFK